MSRESADPRNGDAVGEDPQLPGESSAFFHALFDNVPLIFFALDRDGFVLDVNAHGVDVLGYSRDDLVSTDVLRVFHPEDRTAVEAQVEALARMPGKVGRWELRKLRRDGSELWVQETAKAFEMDGEIRIIVLCEDISQRKTVEERIKGYRARLRSLTLELAVAEESERRRIASGLHDEIGQKLALALLRLGEMGASLPDGHLADVERLRELLDEAVKQTRSLTFELASPVLYELGLQAALADIGERLIKANGLELRFDARGNAKPLSEQTQIILYRAVQELLLNVVKHSGASKVHVDLEWRRSEIVLRVLDDGKSFDPQLLAAESKDVTALGLFKTRERLTQLGGWVKIDPAPGNGTCITVWAPIP